jgi:hypothetical protein
MTKQIFIGLFTEGPTDQRFLQSVVRKAFDEVAFEAPGDFEFYIEPIKLEKSGLGFVEKVINVAKAGVDKYGISILCIHKDADSDSEDYVKNTQINPAINNLKLTKGNHCQVVVPIIPVHMIEAWLLADKNLFKQALGTDKSDIELGIEKHPETIHNPKEVIEKAIKISQQHRTRRKRHNLSISEIYMPLGEEIDIKELSRLPSFKNFRQSVRNAFIELNYLPS